MVGRLGAASRSQAFTAEQPSKDERPPPTSPPGAAPPELTATAVKAAKAFSRPVKKAWSFEKDIEAWKAHCEKTMAQEREEFKAQLDQKDAEITELIHVAIDGREKIYDELTEIQQNHWESLLINANTKLRQMTSAYRRLCQVKSRMSTSNVAIQDKRIDRNK